MKNSTTFKRTKQNVYDASVQYLTQWKKMNQLKCKEASAKTNRLPGNHKNVSKKVNSKSKGKSSSNIKQSKTLRSKQIDPYDFDCYEAIFNSETYQLLNKQYSLMKTEMNSITSQIKQEIVSLNRNIAREEIKLSNLSNLKENLTAEIDYLTEMEEEIKLKNYELRCQLLAQGGNRGNNFYDSQREIIIEELNYEEIMELQNHLGVVSTGYDEKTIKDMKGDSYSPHCDKGQDLQCCICCQIINSKQTVFRTNCDHIHHLECIGRWLKIKRECPLCRTEIILE